MSYDFVNYSAQPSGLGAPMPERALNSLFPHNQQNSVVDNTQQTQPQIDPRVFETPNITTEGSVVKFTVTDDTSKGSNVIHVDPTETDAEKEKRKHGRVRKESGTGIVRAEQPEAASGIVENKPTAYTYAETNMLLHQTLSEIDMVNSELLQEFNNVKANRAMKNKYNVLTNLSENISSMIGNKLTTIKEINNSISKSNDLDYKMYKDSQAARNAQNDDLYVTQLYKSFMSSAEAPQAMPNMPPVDTSMYGNSGIIRANMNSSGTGITDSGYLNYVSNMTPEQNLMMYEGNPNVKQVIVYDAASGRRFFQYMDMSTGSAIPNVATYDSMLLEEFDLDLQKRQARSLNLKETMPIVVINEGSVASQY